MIPKKEKISEKCLNFERWKEKTSENEIPASCTTIFYQLVYLVLDPGKKVKIFKYFFVYSEILVFLNNNSFTSLGSPLNKHFHLNLWFLVVWRFVGIKKFI